MEEKTDRNHTLNCIAPYLTNQFEEYFMANLGYVFDPQEVQPAADFSPVPAGEYVVMITESEMKPTRTGGEMLSLTHQVIDGEFKGRLIWESLNLVNSNPKTVQIAQGHLSAICHAAGITQAITDSEQLHNRPMIIRVEVDEQEGYRPRNRVKAWKAVGTQPVAPASAPRPAAPAAPARAAPPWAGAR